MDTLAKFRGQDTPDVLVRRWYRTTLTSFGLVAFLMLGTTAARAQTPSDQTTAEPKISVTPTQLTINLRNVTDPNKAKDFPEVGIIQPVIMNTGTAAGNVTFKASFDHDLGSCLSSTVINVEPKEGVHVEPNSALPETLKFYFPAQCAGQTGTLIFNVTGGQPTTASFSLSKDFDQMLLLLPIAILWLPIMAGGAVGVLFLLSMIIFRIVTNLRRRNTSAQCSNKPKKLCFKDPIHVGTSWSFKDSWVTNVSAIGGILATVLAATGFLKLLLPGLPTDRLVGLNLLFTTLVLATPIIYLTWSKWEWSTETDEKLKTLVSRGTGLSVVYAATVTLAGVTGQLATLAVVDYLTQEASAWVKWFIFLILLLGVLLVFVYGIRFSCGVIQPSEEPSATTGNAQLVPKYFRKSEVSGTM